MYIINVPLIPVMCYCFHVRFWLIFINIIILRRWWIISIENNQNIKKKGMDIKCVLVNIQLS